jgi:uncharacterized membrane protein
MPFCESCGSNVQGQFCESCGHRVGAPVTGAPATAAGGLTDNVAGLLCYILGFITGIIFLVLEPYNKSKFVRFHAFQSIFLSVVWVVVRIALALVTALASSVLGGLFGLLALLWTVVGLAFLALVILLMVKAYQGERYKLPIIGDLAEKQA